MFARLAKHAFDGYTISNATPSYTRAKDLTRATNVAVSLPVAMLWHDTTKARAVARAADQALGQTTKKEMGTMRGAWTGWNTMTKVWTNMGIAKATRGSIWKHHRTLTGRCIDSTRARIRLHRVKCKAAWVHHRSSTLAVQHRHATYPANPVQLEALWALPTMDQVRCLQNPG